MAAPTVHVLDYGAGNVRSVHNAIAAAGFAVATIATPADLDAARVVVFPGVGCFAATVDFLDARGFRAPLLAYLRSGRPFMGVCLGMQTLFDASAEAPGARGLGLVPGLVARLAPADGASVPHMGWNGAAAAAPGAVPALAPLGAPGARAYFVHSFAALPDARNAAWVAATTDYGGQRFVSAVARGNVFATQFHPEKSGRLGLAVFRAFLAAAAVAPLRPLDDAGPPPEPALAARLLDAAAPRTRVARRVVACLDVRSNDAGDLVVTKGDQYDVREAGGAGVRNLGKPVELCARYYAEGADEICVLNITAFRAEPLADEPMLRVLEAASERVFVPLTVRRGGARGDGAW